DAPDTAETPEAVDAPDAPESGTSDAAPAAESDTGETAGRPDAETEQAPVTAVSLGLIPEVFVSRVSTQLHFYAPEITPLPARPGRERDDDQEETSGRRGRRRRGGDSEDQRDEPRQRQRAVEYITEPKA